MSETKEDFGPLRFAPKSIIVRPTKDPLDRARKKFVAALQEQSKIASELKNKTSDEMPPDEQRRKRMFFVNGDGKSYIINLKYGKREVVIRKDETLQAADLSEVTDMLDYLVTATMRKEPWLDEALSAVASRSRASTPGTSSNASSTTDGVDNKPTENVDNEKNSGSDNEQSSELEKRQHKPVHGHNRNRH